MSEALERFERSELVQSPVAITPTMRRVIELAVQEVSQRRGWRLLALNVRTEHMHAVVELVGDPRAAVTAFKAFSTRRMREQELVRATGRVWARGGNVRPLPNATAVEAAVDYVVNRQGDVLEGSVLWRR